MPLTEKGEKILSHMKSEYGTKEEGEEVFYASRNAGTISGVDATSSAVPALAPGSYSVGADGRYVID